MHTVRVIKCNMLIGRTICFSNHCCEFLVTGTVYITNVMFLLFNKNIKMCEHATKYALVCACM